jgi:hypothetical protein
MVVVWRAIGRGNWDGKGKATPSGVRKWLVGFGFLAIRSQAADGGNGIFSNEFNARTAIRRPGVSHLLACVASV